MAKPFQDTLSYCSPAHGGWGIIRPCALIPGSYLLFVCPAACFRHGSLGAVQHGFKNRVSFLYIEKSDIVNGYDKLILEGIDELLERARTKIRVLFVYVSCLDDFIGTDIDKVMEDAGRKHPQILFRAAHMNPIASSTKLPPMVTTLNAMSSVLPAWEEKDRDKGVSLFGNFVAIPEEADIPKLLQKTGHPVRQLINCRNFEEYLDMSRSRTILLTKPYAAYTAENLRKRMDIARCDMYVSYDIDIAARQYEVLGETIGENLVSLSAPYREEALEAIGRAREALGSMPVYVSDSAVILPFQLSLALLRYGFNVTRVYAQQVAGPDKIFLQRLTEEHPEVSVIQADHPDMHRRCEGRDEAVAIGEEAAYLTMSRHVVNLAEDEGMLGYYGIRRLMEMMIASLAEEADIQSMIEEYGGIV